MVTDAGQETVWPWSCLDFNHEVARDDPCQQPF